MLPAGREILNLNISRKNENINCIVFRNLYIKELFLTAWIFYVLFLFIVLLLNLIRTGRFLLPDYHPYLLILKLQIEF